MPRFDWHADRITRQTPLDGNYRTTQNVRRFLARELGLETVRFDRALMAWIRQGTPTTMGDVADEYRRRMLADD